MSGWIKVSKDLPDTIRFRRLVKTLRNNSNALRGVTDWCDARYVTMVLGALIRFWMYADTHIDHDDMLSITLDEIDDLVGIDGFAQALPAEWLKVLDADRVQLPDFLEHNGSSEKQRRDNAKRQAAFRHRHKAESVTRYVTDNNARNDARPDQTRPDKTRPEKKQEAPRKARRLPDDFALTDVRRKYAVSRGVDPELTFTKFTNYWTAASGRTATKLDWDRTWQNWCITESERKGATNGHAHRPTFEQLDQRLAALAGDGPLLAGDAAPVRPALEPELRPRAIAVVGGRN